MQLQRKCNYRQHWQITFAELKFHAQNHENNYPQHGLGWRSTPFAEQITCCKAIGRHIPQRQ